MELTELKELIQLINESNLTTFEVEKEGFRVTLKKEVSYVAQPAAISYQPSYAPVQTSVAEETVTVPAGAVEDHSQLPTIKSPIVGTFYEASSPDKAPFVKVGDVVKKGQTLCIIEAMKLMNEIESDVDGKVVEICVKNEQMVEFNTPLFRIQP